MNFTVSQITVALHIRKGKGTPVHKNRPTHGLAYNVDCSTEYRFDTGEVLTCRFDECIYLPKGSNYTVETIDAADTKECGVYAINFLTLPEAGKQKPFVTRIKGKDEVHSLFAKAANAWQKKDVGFYEECFSDLYRIIKNVKREATQYHSQKKTLEILKPALEYINENYTRENISLSRLSSLCSVSEPYLRKLFRLAFSVSPAVYMRNLRLKYAKELLGSKEYSVTDVCMLSGFNDAAYFAREFKKAVGKSPSEFMGSENEEYSF